MLVESVRFLRLISPSFWTNFALVYGPLLYPLLLTSVHQTQSEPFFFTIRGLSVWTRRFVSGLTRRRDEFLALVFHPFPFR